MRKSVFFVALLFMSTAFAQMSYSMPALEAGFKWNSMDADSASSNKQSLAFQLGGSMVINFHEQIGLRTGLFYSERTFKNEFTVGSSSSTNDGKISYAEVPIHFMYKFEDYAGIYIGPSLAMKMSDQCNASSGSCTLSNVKSMIVPITFGAQFKFMPNFGLNLFFETVSGEVAQGLKDSRAIGVNALIAFD